MPFVISSILWVALDTTNAINVCDMSCIVEPSMGLLLVIGGSMVAIRNYKGFQVYNFNSNVWNDWNEYKILIGYPKEIGIRIFQPRSILIELGIVLIWGGKRYNSTSHVIYRLNMKVMPWKWEPISYNMMTVLNSVGIARSRERVFIFGDIEKLHTVNPIQEEGLLMDLLYIYNITESQILLPGYQLSFAFTHSVTDGYRAAGVQPPGSDVVLIYGGVTYQNSSLPQTGNTSDMMLVYNMILRLWMDTVNLVTDVSTNNFAFLAESYLSTLNPLNPSITNCTSNPQHLYWPIEAIIIALILGTIIIGCIIVIIYLIKRQTL
ncbi:19848_t:CDS:2 [Cetraspora pellucida]|uniref:19848_t:CDS:1 n=1 Tax=Cetraspora pellucida TaxID=1433469 RepID=A0A9N9GCN3_9GLOM|nr:19848_t:CDS:2 [Cetraspora pellucida]